MSCVVLGLYDRAEGELKGAEGAEGLKEGLKGTDRIGKIKNRANEHTAPSL